jgi:hypothetical protein
MNSLKISLYKPNTPLNLHTAESALFRQSS